MSEVLFTTRKNMLPTPERDQYIEYVRDIAEFGIIVEDPEELEKKDGKRKEDYYIDES